MSKNIHFGHYQVKPHEQNALLAQMVTVIIIDRIKTMTGALFFRKYCVICTVLVFASMIRPLLSLTPVCISLMTSSPASSSSFIICVFALIYFTALLRYVKSSSFFSLSYYKACVLTVSLLFSSSGVKLT